MGQMELVDNLHLKCSVCGRNYILDKNCIMYEYFPLSERQMGYETEHIFSGEMQCETCDNSMSFKIRGYEYPEDTFNNQAIETSGCEFTVYPRVEIVWNYYFDYDSNEECEVQFFANSTEQNICNFVNDPNSIYNISPDNFENLVAEVFRKYGFKVMITQRTRDGGKDIIASYNLHGIPCMFIIECKRYASDRKVGVGIVRQLHGTQNAEHYGNAVVVTSSTFTKDAQKFAKDINNMVVLVDRDKLLEMINSISS